MALKTEGLGSELIDAICERVREEFSEDEAALCEPFVRQYYRWVPPDDLARRSEDELYGIATTHWKLARVRRDGEPSLRVLNPTADRDGWQSPRTVVQVVSDDMPFIVDSVTMEVGRQGHSIDLVIHPVIVVRRDEDGRMIEVLDPDVRAPGAIAESVLGAELLREPDADRLEQLRAGIQHVLEEVRAAVEDWQPMRERMLGLAEGLLASHPDDAAGLEVVEFLRWVSNGHFTYLGYREYDFESDEEEAEVRAVEGSGLGILRGAPRTPSKQLSRKALRIARSRNPLILTKANSKATVHRPAYLDYIGVKRFGPGGEVSGECRFLGLYTSPAYRASAREVPLLRGKVQTVLDRAGLPPAGYDEKALLEILETYPRDSLIQIGDEDLYTIAIGLLALGERPWVRLFAWRDPLDRFVSCLVTIPRDRYVTDNRERVGRILMEAFGGTQLDYTVQLTESVLVRVNYVIRCAAGVRDGYDLEGIERRLVRATRAWSDELRAALVDEHGEQHGLRLYRRYKHAFGTAYQSDADGRTAVQDIDRLERLASGERTMIALYRPPHASGGVLRCKLYSSTGISLSDVLPTFEHMGARVVDERPHQVQPQDAEPAWIYDFGLQCQSEELERVASLFEAAFLDARRGRLEDDALNGLVLSASLPGREVTILRAISKYLRQVGLAYSDAYISRTLLGYSGIARLFVSLFGARLDPDDRDPQRAEQLEAEIEAAIDGVPSLDQDRILRNFLAVVRATVRTSYFRNLGEAPPEYLSFKLEPATIPAVPEPRPRFEVFVYSPRFEGVHLRGGNVARGGIRWSDRPEDFRTEVLGLLKAQMVKNALIVPVGAKGGFVLKRPPAGAEELHDEAVACYRLYLDGLLDVTDNIRERKVVGPDRVVRHDDDDPYLVVAADKGTAAFSDIANEVAAEYGFWLGDAFASGGSHGYDHKQMGVTARGAWESVKRHFRELGTDIQDSPFTVAGIGDMSGDVFGNGMLLSAQIKLVAAFNHRHVFLDPDPDPSISFSERKRLFEEALPWDAYDRDAISEGGGVHERHAKSISITPQVAEALAIDADELSPPDLIQAILRAPVDLLWNGGVGTYVKALDEANADADDKANDALRVNGRELRCKVVGEGGNLGFTQLGRIEYATAGGPGQQGGRINTDSIDNVGGVNSSDHEVNIKILLDGLVADGESDLDARNELLAEMTDAVAEQVRYGSYSQSEAISVDRVEAPAMIDVHARLIRRLEQVAGLKRELEFLPSEDEISDRKAAGRGLVSPELAIVMAYCKIFVYGRLLESDLPDDEDLSADLEAYFPEPLPKRYADRIKQHRLRREIVATRLANQLVERAGATFAFRLADETGSSLARLARGYAVAREVFEMRSFWQAVERLDNRVDAAVQLGMLIEGRRLVERGARWLVSANREPIRIADAVRRFEPGVELLAESLPGVLDESDGRAYDETLADLREAGVPQQLAARVAAARWLPTAFELVAVASSLEVEERLVMETYFGLGSRLELGWLRDRITELPRANRWEALTRAALREDLASIQRQLTAQVLEPRGGRLGAEEAIERWWRSHEEALERSLATVADVRASRTYDTTTLPVALRELRALVS